MWEINLGIILLTMEVMTVSTSTVTKAAMAKGMSNYVFAAYTHAISIFFLLPVSLLLHRKTPPPPIGLSMILRLFLLGTIKMEIVNLRARSSMLKSIGTIVSIMGAFIVTFYQGLPITLFSSTTKPTLHSLSQEIQPNWPIGALLLATSSIFLSLGYIAKTWIARDFHSEVLITLISCFFETIVAALVTFVAENDPSVWTPSIRIEWISIILGALSVSVANTISTWACRVKGPVFVAMFKPLEMIIAVIMGVSFLGDILYVGSVIGGLIIALGFYTVMKGKTQEETIIQDAIIQIRRLHETQEETCLHKVPLLLNTSMDV